MALNEGQFVARIVAALDERELPARVTSRLMTARMRALDVAAKESLASRNTLILSKESLVGLVGAFLFLIAAGALYSSTMSSSGQDNTDIDAAVLTGDLPVHAYLDRGFEAYVRQGLSTD